MRQIRISDQQFRQLLYSYNYSQTIQNLFDLLSENEFGYVADLNDDQFEMLQFEYSKERSHLKDWRLDKIFHI